MRSQDQEYEQEPELSLDEEVRSLQHFLGSRGWEFLRNFMVAELGSIMKRAMDAEDPYKNMKVSGEMKAYDTILKLPEQRLGILKHQLEMQSKRQEE